MGEASDDVHQAIDALRTKAVEVQAVQNKVQKDLTAALDDLVELEQLHQAIERLRVRTKTQNELIKECNDLENRCKKAEDRLKVLQGGP